MPETWTTYYDTEAITWQVVRGIARAVNVERDVLVPAPAATSAIDWASLCEACNARPRIAHALARYCAECSPIMRAKADRQSRLRRRKPCLSCGALIAHSSARCRSCYALARRGEGAAS